jgi:hypothetical protein
MTRIVLLSAAATTIVALNLSYRPASTAGAADPPGPVVAHATTEAAVSASVQPSAVVQRKVRVVYPSPPGQ